MRLNVKIKSVVLLVSLAASLSGCVLTPTQPDRSEQYWLRTDQPAPSNAVASLLHYGVYVRGLSLADREREQEKTRLAYTKGKTDFQRLQYAFALSAGSVSDRQRALTLTEPFASDKGHDPEMAALANMLTAHLQATRRADDAQRRGEDQTRRADELEKKLEAMKVIERKFLLREKGTRH